MWKMRNLTYYGKITIIKSLLISQIVYVWESCWSEIEQRQNHYHLDGKLLQKVEFITI